MLPAIDCANERRRKHGCAATNIDRFEYKCYFINVGLSYLFVHVHLYMKVYIHGTRSCKSLVDIQKRGALDATSGYLLCSSDRGMSFARCCREALPHSTARSMRLGSVRAKHVREDVREYFSIRVREKRSEKKRRVREIRVRKTSRQTPCFIMVWRDVFSRGFHAGTCFFHGVFHAPVFIGCQARGGVY